MTNMGDSNARVDYDEIWGWRGGEDAMASMCDLQISVIGPSPILRTFLAKLNEQENRIENSFEPTPKELLDLFNAPDGEYIIQDAMAVGDDYEGGTVSFECSCKNKAEIGYDYFFSGNLQWLDPLPEDAHVPEKFFHCASDFPELDYLFKITNRYNMDGSQLEYRHAFDEKDGFDDDEWDDESADGYVIRFTLYSGGEYLELIDAYHTVHEGYEETYFDSPYYLGTEIPVLGRTQEGIPSGPRPSPWMRGEIPTSRSRFDGSKCDHCNEWGFEMYRLMRDVLEKKISSGEGGGDSSAISR